jgi:hypothetical protein
VPGLDLTFGRQGYTSGALSWRSAVVPLCRERRAPRPAPAIRLERSTRQLRGSRSGRRSTNMLR